MRKEDLKEHYFLGFSSPTDNHLSDICCYDFHGRGGRDATWTFQG